MPETIDEQLVKHLTDVHSIEEQALQQMRVAPRLAHDRELAQAFREHITETEDHERRVRARLEARGADPSKVKDLVARAGGVGMVLFARSQPDTPGKLTAHAFSYEHMELAAYDLLALVAERAGDRETVDTARSIREQEAAMSARLEACFDRAVEASLRDTGPDDLSEQLNKYLADAHAIEAQAVQLLSLRPARRRRGDGRAGGANHGRGARRRRGGAGAVRADRGGVAEGAGAHFLRAQEVSP